MKISAWLLLFMLVGAITTLAAGPGENVAASDGDVSSQPAEKLVQQLAAIEIIVSEVSIDVASCPTPLPFPKGWTAWKGSVSKELQVFSKSILRNLKDYPVGTFIQFTLHGQRVGARIDWHTLQAATGRRGCFQSVNLLRPVLDSKAGEAKVSTTQAKSGDTSVDSESSQNPKNSDAAKASP
jgi:hypothetical protein